MQPSHVPWLEIVSQARFFFYSAQSLALAAIESIARRILYLLRYYLKSIVYLVSQERRQSCLQSASIVGLF